MVREQREETGERGVGEGRVLDEVNAKVLIEQHGTEEGGWR